ncbi:hypothetical protein [Tsukamurella tyrosinosolvens]|uniref:hypothetical protein n=1 Tax=Tsukamurella tyrosinosolvens TaxID=57704 RepID=UPI002DD4488C|nr:hypothetical protein [Tsukamurella tyrosinosolvens]MEC4616289.1 hypothetical protein [Tsukamurella tyrosinosolvens]
MAWFKVDDQLHNHRKARAVLRSAASKRRDAAPMGLWALAGSWCGQNRTGGFIPAELLDDWDDDAQALAERLIDAGLWRRDEVDGEPGYRFHDWADRNPAGAGEGGDPLVSASARANHVRWHVKRGRAVPDCSLCVPSDPADSVRNPVGFRSESADQVGSLSDLCSTDSDLCSTVATAVSPQVVRGDPVGFRSDSDRNPPVPVPDPDRSGGYVSGERYDAQTRAIANEPPPPSARCEKHPRGTTAACADCRANRVAADADAADHRHRAAQERAEKRTAEAAAKASAIAACGLCNADGYRGAVVCDHLDHAPAAARGRAKVQAELAAIAARRAS